jgi:hypothetical protein
VKYLLLLNNDKQAVDSWRTMSPEEAQAAREQEIPKWNDLFAWAGQQGLELNGLELDDPGDARVVRVRDGEQLVSDGPFAETKEQIGGYFLVDCKDLDQAIEVAQRVPVALTGSVEIRPLVESQ